MINLSTKACSSKSRRLVLRDFTRVLALGSMMVAWIAGMRSSRRFSMSTVLFHRVGVSCNRLRSFLAGSCGKSASCLILSRPVARGLRWKNVTRFRPFATTLATSDIASPARTLKFRLCPKQGALGHFRRLNAFTSFAALSVTAKISGSLHFALTSYRAFCIASEVCDPSTTSVDKTFPCSCHRWLM